jgi:hypothetical protein
MNSGGLTGFQEKTGIFFTKNSGNFFKQIPAENFPSGFERKILSHDQK